MFHGFAGCRIDSKKQVSDGRDHHGNEHAQTDGQDHNQEHVDYLLPCWWVALSWRSLRSDLGRVAMGCFGGGQAGQQPQRVLGR
jgi:hypothetical protein